MKICCCFGESYNFLQSSNINNMNKKTFFVRRKIKNQLKIILFPFLLSPVAKVKIYLCKTLFLIQKIVLANYCIFQSLFSYLAFCHCLTKWLQSLIFHREIFYPLILRINTLRKAKQISDFRYQNVSIIGPLSLQNIFRDFSSGVTSTKLDARVKVSELCTIPQSFATKTCHSTINGYLCANKNPFMP